MINLLNKIFIIVLIISLISLLFIIFSNDPVSGFCITFFIGIVGTAITLAIKMNNAK